MRSINYLFKRYIEPWPFDSGDPDCKAVLNQLFQAYRESEPSAIRNGFKELDVTLGHLPLDDNNAVFNLCCRDVTAYEHKAFLNGLPYGRQLMMGLEEKKLHKTKNAPC